MQKYNLGSLSDDVLGGIGGKARGLDKLIKAGYNVPNGFVLSDINLNKDLDQAVVEFANCNLGTVAVRSSATREDGAEFSYAGQFVTVLNVADEVSFKQAIVDCVSSLNSNIAHSYESELVGLGSDETHSNNQKTPQVKMNVVVQKMLVPSIAGVCFTVDPQNQNKILVEAVKGLGEALVSGAETATQYSVDRDNISHSITDINSPLNSSLLQQICIEALEIEKLHDCPQDLEWAVADGQLHWLQTRSITTSDAASVDEFNPKHDIKGHAITKFNVGEMLPGAITPLSLSTTIYAIDWGMRKMMHVVGVNKKMQEIPPLGVCFTVDGHFFMDLTQLYGIANSTLLAGKKNIDLSICDRELTADEEGKILTKKKNFFARAHYSFKYISFLFSHKKAKKKIAKLADGTTLSHDNTIEGIYLAVAKVQHSANMAALYHYITSGHGGAMSSATTIALDKRLQNSEKSKGVMAELLERIDGIESVDILNSLIKLGDAVLKENPNAKEFSDEQLAEFLETAGKDVKDAEIYFMSRHGHRAIREAELRSKSWANDRPAFIKYLKTVIVGGMAATEKQIEPNFKAILKKHGFKGIDVGKITFLAKQARLAVINREFSKAKLIKIFDKQKQLYNLLAEKLVDLGKLPDVDAIFFLTHDEIGKVIKGEDTGKLAKKAVQRRKIIKTQQQLSFKEVYADMPHPIVVDYASGEHGDVLTGLPVSRGLVTGKARVVTCAEEAEQLQKGEIMVAQFTDIGWSPFYSLVDGLVTEVGSALSHGAVVAREYAIPLVSSIAGATKLIKTGETITVDGFTGTVVKVKQ